MPPHTQLESDPLCGDEKYEMVKQLGRGAFGSVVLAKEKDTGQPVRAAAVGCRRAAARDGQLPAHICLTLHLRVCKRVLAQQVTRCDMALRR
jgi:serine/threonine protein kinase